MTSIELKLNHATKLSSKYFAKHAAESLVQISTENQIAILMGWEKLDFQRL